MSLHVFCPSRMCLHKQSNPNVPLKSVSWKFWLYLKWAAAWQNQQNYLCAQRRLRSALASAQFDQSSLSAWRKLGSLAIHWADSELGVCPNRPESSLAAHVMLLVLPCCGSFSFVLVCFFLGPVLSVLTRPDIYMYMYNVLWERCLSGISFWLSVMFLWCSAECVRKLKGWLQIIT